MPSIPELLSGHVTLEVECLDRLYLNGYIGSLATSGGLVTFMGEQFTPRSKICVAILGKLRLEGVESRPSPGTRHSLPKTKENPQFEDAYAPNILQRRDSLNHCNTETA
jgi:hypothetical protein